MTMKWPTLSETDLIELYHLQSFPQTRVLSQAGLFDFQSSGLALRSHDTSIEIAIQFEPANYSACFLPLLRENSSIYWDKRSKISYSDKLDLEYWQQSSFLGILNGIVYSNFVTWVDKYIIDHPFYIPHSVCSSADATTCFISSQTSETFVVHSLAALADLTVEMHTVLPLRTTEIRILSEREPKAVISGFMSKQSQTLSLSLSPIHTNKEVPSQTDDAVLYANNTNSSFSWFFKEENTTVSISDTALAQYYSRLVSCMSEFELEPYHSALRSCITEKALFVHNPTFGISSAADFYYMVVPRYPFVFYHHYIVDIPHARISDNANNLGDSVIGLLLLAFAVLGFVFSVWRMKLFDWCGLKARVIKRRAIEGVKLMKERIQEKTKKVTLARRTKADIVPNNSWGQSLFYRHWRGSQSSLSPTAATDDDSYNEGVSLLHSSSSDAAEGKLNGTDMKRRSVELTRLDTSDRGHEAVRSAGSNDEFDLDSELSPAGVRAFTFHNAEAGDGVKPFLSPNATTESSHPGAINSSSQPLGRFNTVINFV